MLNIGVWEIAFYELVMVIDVETKPPTIMTLFLNKDGLAFLELHKLVRLAIISVEVSQPDHLVIIHLINILYTWPPLYIIQYNVRTTDGSQQT